jgi:hypothetical protein
MPDHRGSSNPGLAEGRSTQIAGHRTLTPDPDAEGRSPIALAKAKAAVRKASGPTAVLGWQSSPERERGRHRRMCPPAPHPLPSCRQLPRSPLPQLAVAIVEAKATPAAPGTSAVAALMLHRRGRSHVGATRDHACCRRRRPVGWRPTIIHWAAGQERGTVVICLWLVQATATQGARRERAERCRGAPHRASVGRRTKEVWLGTRRCLR